MNRENISLQLYSLREFASQDFEGTIRKVAAMGYPCVEPAGFPGTTVDEAAKIFKSCGLKVPTLHGRLPVGDMKQEAIDVALKLGATTIISGKGSGDFQSEDSIKAIADEFNEAAANAAKHGLRIGIHNHDWEMAEVNGRVGYYILHELLGENVCFELDTYWAKVGGRDPVTVVKDLGSRIKVLHLKDGVGYRNDPVTMTAVGQGVMDFPAILRAATFAEIAAVELDNCATDMLTAVKESYDYLASIMSLGDS